MSADNGYVIRKNEDEKFVLQYYYASDDELPPIEAAREEMIFDTLETAVLKYKEVDVPDPLLGICTEYGLTISTREITPPSTKALPG